ncbi:MAG TPA: aldo/keto reductase [Candidatus Atribacteria bacterium]|nr:aldo/keto reductase [Candidatus Atribacteria bacterium]
MEYRVMEKIGVKASLLGFGCMRFPRKDDGSINEELAAEMIETAYKSGVNYFDTAYGYHNGESERFTGRVLDRFERSSYYLATKLPCWLVHTREDVRRLFNEQLQKLNKEYVDFYLLHALNKGQFDRMVSLGVLDILDDLRKEGRIRYIGFSFHDSFDAFKYILEYRQWDFCQIQLNYMDTDIQAGLKGYELTEKYNIPLIIMEPVKGGSLARLPENVDRILKEADPDRSTASWALRWVASLPNVKVVLSGMSDMDQVMDNLKTFDGFKALSDEEKQAIDAVVKAMRSRVKNGCTGCRYCMPCPSGVDIPENFSIWNEYGIYDNIWSTKWRWENQIDDSAKAKNCIECGKCEEACPQNLSIREDLKTLQAELDAL